jgi:5-methylcytosine-specific restriction enzyme A
MAVSCPGCERERQRRRDRSRPPGWQRFDAAYRAVREQILADEERCWLCYQPGDEHDPLEVDHVVPKAQGGSDDRSNLRAAHRSCNRRRRGRRSAASLSAPSSAGEPEPLDLGGLIG